MKVLVACEESQMISSEFRKKGHYAFSCDLQPCSGNHPEFHIMADVIPLLNGFCEFATMDGSTHYINTKWDLIIAHPPCTYLSNAGARWLYKGKQLNEERYQKGLAGRDFFMKFFEADCDHIAIENPIPSLIYNLPECSQKIQPYYFGDPWSKKTCLWLKGLPLLEPTEILTDYKPYCSSGSYSGTHDPKYKGASRKGGSAKSRSKTFPGVAKAMAQQWGVII